MVPNLECMSEFTEEYRIAQLLSKKMTGELTPEEEQELQEWEQNSPSAKEVASQVLNPMNKRHRDKFMAKTRKTSSSGKE